MFIGGGILKEIYLDNSATTKVYTEAAEAAFKVMTEIYGNPSSLHMKGVEAEKVLEEARKEEVKIKEEGSSDETTIRIDFDVKDKLDEVKIIPAEPYNDVIVRLIEEYKKHNKS